jgi:hypothetical protein
MKIFVATVVIATMLAGPAFAQMGKGNPSAEKDPRREQMLKDEKERAVIEKEYNETMARTRSTGPAPKTDPWAKVRPADSASTANTKR